VRQLATARPALASFFKFRAFPDMVALALDTLCTVAKNCKVFADTVLLGDVDVGEETVLPCAAAAVEKVDTEGSAFWSWIM